METFVQRVVLCVAAPVEQLLTLEAIEARSSFQLDEDDEVDDAHTLAWRVKLPWVNNQCVPSLVDPCKIDACSRDEEPRGMAAHGDAVAQGRCDAYQYSEGMRQALSGKGESLVVVAAAERVVAVADLSKPLQQHESHNLLL